MRNWSASQSQSEEKQKKDPSGRMDGKTQLTQNLFLTRLTRLTHSFELDVILILCDDPTTHHRILFIIIVNNKTVIIRKLLTH